MFYKNDYYEDVLKQKNNKIIYGNSAPRGRILDKFGNIIVDNVGIKTIIYNKIKNIDTKDEIDIAKKLGEVIDMDFGNQEELKYYFREFAPYEGRCRFNGCDHVHEPDCAVKRAVAEGKIARERYESYVMLYQELKEQKRY